MRVLSAGGKPVVGQNVIFSLPEGESGSVVPATATGRIAQGEAQPLAGSSGTVPGDHALEARLCERGPRGGAGSVRRLGRGRRVPTPCVP